MKSFIQRACLKVLKMTGQRYVAISPLSLGRHCPICGYQGVFRAFGEYYIRPDAICPGCNSVERHRLLKTLADCRPELFRGRVLHFAPEPPVERFVRTLAEEYVTADYFRDDLDHRWNIEAIDCSDGRFDAVICSHVLEHVDATQALSEVHRVLKPGGVGVIMIPICEGLDATYENPRAAAGNDQDRWMNFQQADHVRVFGRDFRDRITQSGFKLDEYVAQGEAAVEHGLVMGERVFLAEAVPAPRHQDNAKHSAVARERTADMELDA